MMDPEALACWMKAAGFASTVISADCEEYEKRRRVWNAMADRRPAAIVRASSIGDVQRVVAMATEHHALLAVRGGGHSLPGLSTCNGGIVLDLSLLNAVSIDAGTTLADCGGGALLGDLDRICEPLGRVVPAGVISHTGVAGLTLGGGMGWLSRRFGLTIDSLREADIITADGVLRTVNADTESDLFWAIRGGGGNFGVVTRFGFVTHVLQNLYVGTWEYSPSDVYGVLSRLQEAAEDLPNEVGAAVVFTREVGVVTALCSGSVDYTSSYVSRFGELGAPLKEEIGGSTLIELQSRSDNRFPWGRRCYAKGGFFSSLTDEGVRRVVHCLALAPVAGAEIYLLRLGGRVSDVSDEATAYTGRTAGWYWLAEVAWDNAADDSESLAWCRESSRILAAICTKSNYVNEQGDADCAIALNAYGPSKYRRLAAIKARYDPENLFKLNQNIIPANT